jgi:nitrous oxide reductase accessory protein NosL
MKYLTVIIAIAIAVVLFVSTSKKDDLVATIEGNTQKQPIKIIPNHFTDVQCAMTIKDEHHACEVVSPNGKTWFFDDIGCLVKWLEDKSFKDQAIIWTHAEDTGAWIDAKKAWYTLTDRTPMHYGFGAREKKEDGVISYDQMRLKMLRGENMTDPRIRKKLLGI